METEPLVTLGSSSMEATVVEDPAIPPPPDPEKTQRTAVAPFVPAPQRHTVMNNQSSFSHFLFHARLCWLLGSRACGHRHPTMNGWMDE